MSLEEEVKQRLLSRGFSEKTLLNNRGLIGAVIDEVTQNDNCANRVLTAGAVKEAVEILSSQMNLSLHYSKFPQEQWKNEPEQPEISVLISSAEFHSKRCQDIKSVIDYLVVSFCTSS